ncbi:MAG: two-component hybrid sensor and regulator [Verrucomicrobiales bacterium]|nr:two-component hybrid sensor and regulator [Verrucomicrobiales bacterium]
MKPGSLQLSSDQTILPGKLRFITAALGSYALLGGLMTLYGRAANIPRLTDWANTGICMLPNMGAALTLAGTALILSLFGYRRIVMTLGFLTSLVGAMTLIEYITGVNLGIDTLLLHRDWGQAATSNPGRIGPPGATSLTIIGASLVLCAMNRMGKTVVTAAMLVIGITALSIIGYIFGASNLYSLPYLTTISLPTATILLALSIGLIVSVPHLEPMKTILGNSAQSALVRSALPFVILVPLVVGWMRLQGQLGGLYDAAFGTSLRTIVEIALLIGLLWWAAAAVGTRETALRESEAVLRTVTNEARVGLVMVNRDRRYLFANHAYAEILALPNADIVGQRVADVLAPMYNQIAPRLDAAFKGERVSYELHMAVHPKSGEERFYEVVYEPRIDKSVEPYVVVVIVDITERKKIQQTLERAVAERTSTLQANYHTMEAFNYSIAHDLRSPLRAMTGFADALMLDYGASLDATAQDYVRRIGSGAQRMDRLVNDLLTYGRLAHVELTFEKVSVESLVAAAIVDLSAEIEKVNARVDVRPVLFCVIANRSVLQQVVVNLISNGLKFIAPDVAPQLVIRTEAKNGSVRLWVEDNGIGIHADHQARIFEVFERLHSHQQYPGTGIGLALVKMGLERMSGKCGVESECGQGSRFWIELPQG